MAQSIIDLVNVGGGVQMGLAPQAVTLSGATGAQIVGENMTDPVNLLVNVGAGTTCSGFQIWLEETYASGGTSGWTAITGTLIPATSGNTQAAVGASGQTFVSRGYRNYEYFRCNAVNVQGTSGGSLQLSAVVVGQGKYTATGGGVQVSGQTAVFGTGSDRWPST